MRDFRYALIRFIPDMSRMEPTNVGVILQGAGRVDFKLSPHAAKRKIVDTDVWQTWKKFFQEEIRGEAIPLFQPPRNSPAFLENLARLCEHTVSVTHPLAYQASEDEAFDQILETLYNRLVAPLENSKSGPSVRPTSKYRELEEEKDFQKRGVKKRPYLTFQDKRHWNAYRQVMNEDVIDKIEVANTLGDTADEIQKLASGVDPFISEFLKKDSKASAKHRYWLIADRLTEKFTDQSDEDFEIMREELEKVVETVEKGGGTVIRETTGVQQLVDEIDKKLPHELSIAS